MTGIRRATKRASFSNVREITGAAIQLAGAHGRRPRRQVLQIAPSTASGRAQRVARMLSNETYAGTWHYGRKSAEGELIPVTVPAIVNFETPYHLGCHAGRGTPKTGSYADVRPSTTISWLAACAARVAMLSGRKPERDQEDAALLRLHHAHGRHPAGMSQKVLSDHKEGRSGRQCHLDLGEGRY